MAEKLYWLRQPLWQAAFIILGLLLCAFYLAFSWISTLPPLAQALLGAALGLTAMASYSNTQTQRSQYRRRTSVNLAQLSLADMLALQRLLPNHEKALSWLPGPSDMELVRWINVGLEKAWPFVKEASSDLIKAKLETVYNKYRAGAITEISICRINLGKFSPFVQGIKTFPSNKDNQCCLEIQLDWRQNEDQDMLLHVSTTGPEFVVQVKNFVVYCVLRLTFMPLTLELPCFAAVMFSIIEPVRISLSRCNVDGDNKQPLVDFQTKFISGDVKKMPGMEKTVDNILLSTVMDLLVWPSRVVVPILPGDYSDLEASCVGHLHVQLVEARDLANKDVTGRSDPYVVLFVRRRTDLIKQSTQMHDTDDPVWNEQFLFDVEDSEVQRLTIKLMNRDENLDVFVGIAELAIVELEANVPEDLWIDLVGDPAKLQGRFAGKIHLLLEFKPKNYKGDKNDSGSWAFEVNTSLAVSMVQPDGRLSSCDGGGQFIMDHPSGNRAPSCGLGVILEDNGIVSVDDDFRVVMRKDAVASLTDSSDIEAKGRHTLIADIKGQPGELAGNNENSTCLEEKTPHVEDGDFRSASGVVVVPVESFESDRQLLGVEGTGFQECISQKHGETWSAVPGGSTSTKKSCEACIAENDSYDNVDAGKDTVNQPNVGMGKDTVNQPNLVVVGDPAWGLNGLSLEDCNTLAIHEDMFSSEIFEID